MKVFVQSFTAKWQGRDLHSDYWIQSSEKLLLEHLHVLHKNDIHGDTLKFTLTFQRGNDKKMPDNIR